MQTPIADIADDKARMSLSVPNIRQGWLHAYFVYDVADTIELAALKDIGGGFQQAQLALRAMPSPGYIQFAIPPLSVDLPDEFVGNDKFAVRAKFYDYGVISIRLSTSYEGSWSEFAKLARRLGQSRELVELSKKVLTQLQKPAASAFKTTHIPFMEDYFVFEVGAFESKTTSSELLAKYRSRLAALIMGEEEPLASLEEQDALRFVFSYSENDLAVIHWDTAFVFDNGEGADAVNSILEFANTQLVELRTYDARLDEELDKIYKGNAGRSEIRAFWGRRAVDEQAAQLRRLLVDIRELCDRTNNALKFIGDAFYARLYRGLAVRLGLPDWQQQVESKLSSVGEVYRLTTDQAQNARGEFLEIVVIILILVEIISGVIEAWH
jgi:hypothetical protein